MKKKVYWTMQECINLAEEVFKLRHFGHSMLTAIEMAQKVPGVLESPDRKRKISALSSMPQAFQIHMESLRKKPTQTEPQEAQPELLTPEQKLADALSEYITSVVGPAAQDKFASLVAEKVVAKLQTTLHPHQLAVLEHIRKTPVASCEYVTSKPRKKKVVILGMLQRQLWCLIPEYPTLDLHALPDAAPLSQTKGAVSSADLIFGMTLKMSHRLEQQIISLGKKDVYQRISGGLSAFRIALNKITTEEQ